MADDADVTQVEHDHTDPPPQAAGETSTDQGLWLDRAQDGTWSVMGHGPDGAERVMFVSGRDQQRALEDLKVYSRAARSSPQP